MTECKEGNGKLVSRQTGTQYQVSFDFTIETNLIARSHAVARGKNAIGKVNSTMARCSHTKKTMICTVTTVRLCTCETWVWDNGCSKLMRNTAIHA